MVEIKIDTKGIETIENALGILADKHKNMKPIMDKLGQGMLGIVDRNFEAEGRPTKWKKRSELAQKNLGYQAMKTKSETKKYQKAKRLRTRLRYLREANLQRRSNKILQDSGHLKQSIDSQSENNKVVVGSNLIYARIHHMGGVIRPKRFKTLFVPYGKRLLRPKKVNIPARPFLTVPRSEVPKLAKIVVQEWENCLKGG